MEAGKVVVESVGSKSTVTRCFSKYPLKFIIPKKGIGIVVRIAATTTESVYRFLQHQLSSMEPLLGASPYH